MPLTGLMVFPFACLLFFALCALVWRDVKDGILPDTLTGAFALAALGLHSVTGWSLISPEQALAGVACGGGLVLLMRQVPLLLWKQETLGLGDVKLVAAGGLLLGFPHILAALTLGACFSLVHGLVSWRYEPSGVTLGKINVPAGLGLGLGIAIVWLMQYGFALK